MNKKQSGGWLRDQFARRPKPLWIVITADALLLALSLVVFALFHHVLPRHEDSVGIVSSREALAVSRPAPTAAPAPSEVAVGDVGAQDAAQAEAQDEAQTESANAGILAGDFISETPGDFSEKFADMFTSGEVTKSSTGYKSANVNITLSKSQENGGVYYVADIYIRDISCLVSVFAKNTFGKGIRNWATNISKESGAVIAINGDYYGGRSDGIVIRNGELYRTDKYPDRDVCVIFWDGRMETYSGTAFDGNAMMDAGAYQAWNFGPALLTDEGQSKTRFNSDVGPANPRTALGYYEPGHYCFVVVDGRQEGSSGMTLTNFSALMQKLGCVRAYNMDGGNTSVMVVGDQIVNNPSGGGRPTSDIIAIMDK